MQQLVSIVMATYNGEKYLRCQIDSILQQTYQPIEIIISDDSSQDNTVSILKEYALANKNIQLFLNTDNVGYIKNFERSIQHANGNYIATCDQDDYWEKNKIEELIKNIEDFPMISCDSELVDENLKPLGKKISTVKNLATYTNPLIFFSDNYVAGHAILAKKDFVNKTLPFNNDVPFDWWLAYHATFYGGIKYVDIPLVKYRNHSNNFIGAVKVKDSKRDKESKVLKKTNQNNAVLNRLNLFYNACPNNFISERVIMLKIVKTSQSFTLSNNLQRVALYYNHMSTLLAIKKKNTLRKILYCLKMFYQLR